MEIAPLFLVAISPQIKFKPLNKIMLPPTTKETQKPQAAPNPAGRSIYVIRKQRATRPIWDEMAAKVIKMENTDIKVLSLGDYHAMRRSVTKLGFYLCRHHLEKDSWILRISDKPASHKNNPLKREYQRAYPTVHGRWVRASDELMVGNQVTLATRPEVTLMGVYLRKFYPEDKFPPRTMHFERIPGEKEVAEKAAQAAKAKITAKIAKPVKPTKIEKAASTWRVWVTFN